MEIFRVALAAALVAVQDDLRRAEAGSQAGVARIAGNRGLGDGGEGDAQHGSVWRGSLAEDFTGTVQDQAFIQAWGRRLLASALLVEEKASHDFDCVELDLEQLTINNVMSTLMKNEDLF